MKLSVNTHWRNFLSSLRNNNSRVCVRERKAADIRAHRYMQCTYTFITLTAKTLRKLWNNLVVNYIHFFFFFRKKIY